MASRREASAAEKKQNVTKSKKKEKVTHFQDAATSGSCRTPPPPALEDWRPSRPLPTLCFVRSSCQRRGKEERNRKKKRERVQDKGDNEEATPSRGRAKRSTEETQGHRKKTRGRRRKGHSLIRCSDVRFLPLPAAARSRSPLSVTLSPSPACLQRGNGEKKQAHPQPHHAKSITQHKSPERRSDIRLLPQPTATSAPTPSSVTPTSRSSPHKRCTTPRHHLSKKEEHKTQNRRGFMLPPTHKVQALQVLQLRAPGKRSASVIEQLGQGCSLARIIHLPVGGQTITRWLLTHTKEKELPVSM